MMAQLWFKFWAKEYLADTKVRRLTYEQRGILQTLWAFAWEEGSIPSDAAELGNMLGMSAKSMRTHCEWIYRFFPEAPGDPSKRMSPRLEMDRAEADAKGSRARESAMQRWNKQNANAHANASPNALQEHMRQAYEAPCVSHAGQGQGTEKEKEITPTPFATLQGPGAIVAKPRKPKEPKPKAVPSWQKPIPADVLDAMYEIQDVWPDPKTGAIQPTSKGQPVPHPSWPKTAERLMEIKESGALLEILVSIAIRYATEWRKGEHWIKSPQYFFGKGDEAPWPALYMAELTNRQMRAERTQEEQHA